MPLVRRRGVWVSAQPKSDLSAVFLRGLGGLPAFLGHTPARANGERCRASGNAGQIRGPSARSRAVRSGTNSEYSEYSEYQRILTTRRVALYRTRRVTACSR